MALRLAFVLLFSYAAFGLGNAIPALPTQQCGENAEFHACGSACAPTCANPTPGPVCTLQCVIGCFCKAGFLKNAAGVCVRPQECDAAQPAQIVNTMESKSCDVNEEYSQCKGCDVRCDRRIFPCTADCKPGCACKAGHARDAEGKCVPQEQCKKYEKIRDGFEPVNGMCAVNEKFQPCGTACAATCQNPNPSPVCTKQCVIGCFCEPGHLRNDYGTCVPVHECKTPVALVREIPQCPANEVFNPCGSACAPDCNNPTPSPVCTKQCVPACFCKEGLLRNEKGVCVQTHECKNTEQPTPVAMEMKCPANEMFNPCGSACAPTCANPNPSPVCTKQCVIGCFCAPGYLRNEHGVCVETRECTAAASPMVAAQAVALPPPLCHLHENEVFRLCHSCDATCEHRNPACKRIHHRFCRPGCQCIEGHVRNADGKCVPESHCPQMSPFDPDFKVPEKQCGVNEEFRSCGTACPPTCAHPQPKAWCTKQCSIGCFCKQGFLRNSQGVCVAVNECEKPEA